MTAREVLVAHGQILPDDIPSSELALYVRHFVTPEQIERLEAHMLEMEQIEIPVKHHFSPGVYGREAFFPRDTFAIGHAHTGDCLNLVLKGSVSVMIEGEVRLIKAGDVFVSKAFDRKVGYVHEDMVWVTVHATTETDLQKLEELLIHKSATFKAWEQRTLSSIRQVEALTV